MRAASDVLRHRDMPGDDRLAASAAGGAVRVHPRDRVAHDACLGGSRLAAWCALLAAGLGTTEYAVYARTAMTEALSLPLAAASGLLLVLLVRRPRASTAACLGVGLGLLTLARPEYLYLAAAIGARGPG